MSSYVKPLNLIIETPCAIRRARKELKYIYGERWKNIEQELRSYFPSILNNNAKGCKFYPGLVRLYVNNEINNKSNIYKLYGILKYIVNNQHNNYSEDLNGLSIYNLIKIFDNVVSDKLLSSIEKCNIIAKKVSPKDNYTVVKINSYNDVKKYREYVDWCILDNEDTYNKYLENGLSQLYIVLENNYKNTFEEVRDNHPYDKYGLSMLGIHVNVPDENGFASIKTCAGRWNNSDEYLNEEQITKLLGRNFYDVFKPNMSWLDKTNEINDKLKNPNIPLKDIFEHVNTFNDNISIITIHNKENIISMAERKILSPIWFDLVATYNTNLFKVYLNNKQNFLNLNGTLLLLDWVDNISDFDNAGYARIYVHNKGYNFINSTGKYLNNFWYDSIQYNLNDKNINENNTIYVVYLKDKGFNLLNTKTKKHLLERWTTIIESFSYGLAKIHVKGKGWNFIKLDGSFLLDVWSEYITSFKNGFAVIKVNDKYTLINTEGKQIIKEWFDKLNVVSSGCIEVKLNGKHNYITKNGKLLFNIWLDSIYTMHSENRYLLVLNDKYKIAKSNGEIITDLWFDEYNKFKNGFSKVSLNGKWNFIDLDGNLISNVWFEKANDFNKDGIAKIMLNGKSGEINKKGNVEFKGEYINEELIYNITNYYLN